MIKIKCRIQNSMISIYKKMDDKENQTFATCFKS